MYVFSCTTVPMLKLQSLVREQVHSSGLFVVKASDPSRILKGTLNNKKKLVGTLAFRSKLVFSFLKTCIKFCIKNC
jgi:hypothetical protein